MKPENICLITPTKGRHGQLTCLLRTLEAQTVRVGQIIIADGGRDAERVIEPFKACLPVRWLDCPQPGQIVQRNLALKHVSSNIEVIIYLDDDIQLKPDAIETLFRFWDEQSTPPGGISFNIINNPAQPNNILRHLFFMQTEPRGMVLRSGYNTPIARITENIEAQWLIGGATAWRRDILMTHLNESITSRWAITEDLVFSYSLWKRGERLLVCADAHVEHVDDTPIEDFRVGLFRGYNATVWRYLFVTQNSELSKLLFLWMMIGQTLSRFGSGLCGRTWQFGYILGNVQGMAQCLRSMIFGIDIRRFLR